MTLGRTMKNRKENSLLQQHLSAGGRPAGWPVQPNEEPCGQPIMYIYYLPFMPFCMTYCCCCCCIYPLPFAFCGRTLPYIVDLLYIAFVHVIYVQITSTLYMVGAVWQRPRPVRAVAAACPPLIGDHIRTAVMLVSGEGWRSSSACAARQGGVILLKRATARHMT